MECEKFKDHIGYSECGLNSCHIAAGYIKPFMLNRDAVLCAITDEPEYPDAEDWREEVKDAIMKFPSVDDHVASALADMVISCARMAVTQTKAGITERVMEIPLKKDI